jgi:putative transposase
MKVQRAYRVELDINNCQRTALRCHAGAARWAYNWGLQQKIKAYKETGKSPSAIDLHKELNKLKQVDSSDGGVPWMYNVSKCAPQEALRDLDKAFQGFFRRCRKGSKQKGFPKFKSRHQNPLKFRLTGSIRVPEDGKRIKLPNLGWLRLKEVGYLPGPKREDVKIQSASLSEQAGRWFVSLTCKIEVPDVLQRPRTKVVGVDVGIKNLAVTSDGRVFENPRALAGCQRRLRRAQKALARKQKGSQNRVKAKRWVAKIYYQVSCIRKDALHKATTAIVKEADVLVVESLNVAGMLRNRCLSRALSDASLSEFLRQLGYKAAWSGVQVIEAPRFYPSSKTCSGCGHVKSDLTLSDRVYECASCGLSIDRDLNAAINLKKLAPSSGASACGEDVRPSSEIAHLMATSVKQEPNTEAA